MYDVVYVPRPPGSIVVCEHILKIFLFIQVQTAKTDMYGECCVLIIFVDFVLMAPSANLFSK